MKNEDDPSVFFEVGGPSKEKYQITDKENAYVIKDGIAISYGNIMPMWLFGFLS